MLEFNQGEYIVIFGDDLADVQRWLAANPRKWRSDSSIQSRSYDWDLGCNWEQACKCAAEGWTQGALDLATDLELMAPPVNKHADLKYDVGGYLPDVPRFLSGDPAHMVTKGRRIGNPPIVHLVVNVVCSGATKARAFKEYGTALVAMIDKLEAKDHRVELDLAIVDPIRNKRCILGWKVKRAQDHCDLAAIAFSMAHPAAFRRFGFGLIERLPAELYSPGYGMCGKLTREDAVAIGAPDAFLLDGIGEAYYRGERNMLKLVAEQINKAAGETLVEVEG